uniref:Uncharacterized protein n=1 Tax=Steinernema glaseri TaxID=37863 RepID=A0A1I7YFD6_9BILA
MKPETEHRASRDLYPEHSLASSTEGINRRRVGNMQMTRSCVTVERQTEEEDALEASEWSRNSKKVHRTIKVFSDLRIHMKKDQNHWSDLAKNLSRLTSVNNSGVKRATR